MPFKRILVLLRSFPAPTPAAAIEAAVDMAVALDARLSALSCAILPHVPKSILGGAVPNIGGMVGQERRKIIDDARQLLRHFSESARRRNVVGQELYKECRPSEVPALLAAHARLHDLTIVPLPEGGYLDQLDSRWYLETALFETGRPVLALPHGYRSPGAGAFDTVVVAWDNTRGAARALMDALPILRRAKSVRVVTVSNDKAMPAEPPASEVLVHLAAHGIDAVHDTVDGSGRSAGTVIGRYVHEHAAGLLVMGGYGHPRLREIILGGTTELMLTHPPIPVFMAH